MTLNLFKNTSILLEKIDFIVFLFILLSITWLRRSSGVVKKMPTKNRASTALCVTYFSFLMRFSENHIFQISEHDNSNIIKQIYLFLRIKQYIFINDNPYFYYGFISCTKKCLILRHFSINPSNEPKNCFKKYILLSESYFGFIGRKKMTTNKSFLL